MHLGVARVGREVAVGNVEKLSRDGAPIKERPHKSLEAELVRQNTSVGLVGGLGGVVEASDNRLHHSAAGVEGYAVELSVQDKVVAVLSLRVAVRGVGGVVAVRGLGLGRGETVLCEGLEVVVREVSGDSGSHYIPRGCLKTLMWRRRKYYPKVMFKFQFSFVTFANV